MALICCSFEVEHWVGFFSCTLWLLLCLLLRNVYSSFSPIFDQIICGVFCLTLLFVCFAIEVAEFLRLSKSHPLLDT